LHAELIADTVEGTINPLNRNSAAMVVLLANSNVPPGSVSVPSGGRGGDEDDHCSFIDAVTVHSSTSAGSPVGGAAASIHLCSAGGSTTMISPAGGVTVTPLVTKNHPLALYYTSY
jgi:hypothetical protein